MDRVKAFWGGGGAAIAAIAIIAIARHYTPEHIEAAAPDTVALAETLRRQPECKNALADLSRFGPVRRTALNSPKEMLVYVEDGLWERLGKEGQLRCAMTAYCAFTPADGYFTVTVRNIAGRDIYFVKNGRTVTAK